MFTMIIKIFIAILIMIFFLKKKVFSIVDDFDYDNDNLSKNHNPTSKLITIMILFLIWVVVDDQKLECICQSSIGLSSIGLSSNGPRSTGLRSIWPK